MRVNKRDNNGTLVVDLLGQFPTEVDEILSLGESIRDAVVGQTGPIIFHIPDADTMSSLHIGALLGAIKQANVASNPLSVVSPHEGIRDVFQVVSRPLLRPFATEAAALKSLGL